MEHLSVPPSPRLPRVVAARSCLPQKWRGSLLPPTEAAGGLLCVISHAGPLVYIYFKKQTNIGLPDDIPFGKM